LFWGLKTKKDIYFFDELKKLSNQGLNFKICLSREKNLESVNQSEKEFFYLGHVDDCCLNDFRSDKLNDFEYYICGSKKIVNSIKNRLMINKVEENKIFLEKY